MVTMTFLPNRGYCAQFASITTDNVDPVALRILSYGLLELVSLILIDWNLRKHLRFSPTAQLAMVLETHWASVQAGFIIWVVYTIQGLLEHYG